MPADPIERRFEAFPVSHFQGEGFALAYRDVGRGPPLVLLHGIGSGSASWLRQFEQPPVRRRLLAWDAPGYGVSTCLPLGPPSAAAYAQRLTAWLDGLDLAEVDLVGHSLGAIIAAAFAARAGERTRRLILIDPARGYASDTAQKREERLRARLEALASLGPRGLADARAGALLSDGAEADARALVHWNMAQVRPDGYRHAAQMLAGADILKDAARYRGKALVLCGAKDSITPPKLAMEVAAAMPNARYVELPGAGHASYIENPQAFAAALTDHLED